MDHSTTISDIIQGRAERGLADLLLTVYDAGYCAGANLPSEAPGNAGLADLLSVVADRHRAEVLALRGWLDPQIAADDIPGWLLSVPRHSARGE